MGEITKASRVQASDVKDNLSEVLTTIGYAPEKSQKQRVYSNVQKFFDGVVYSLKEFFMKPADTETGIPEYLALVFEGDDGEEVETSIGFWFKSVYHGEDAKQEKTTWKGLPAKVKTDTDFLQWLCDGGEFTVAENGAHSVNVTHVWDRTIKRRPRGVKPGEGWYKVNPKTDQHTWIYDFVVE